MTAETLKKSLSYASFIPLMEINDRPYGSLSVIRILIVRLYMALVAFGFSVSLKFHSLSISYEAIGVQSSNFEGTSVFISLRAANELGQ